MKTCSFQFTEDMLTTKHLLFFAGLLICVSILLSPSANAQVMNWQETHRGSIYFSVGYDKQWYQKSSVHVNQPSLNSLFVLSDVTATDQGAATGITSPLNMNYRLGYFFNYGQSVGIELCYDPCKYYITNNEPVHMSGTFDGARFDSTIGFTKLNGYYYNLKEGMGTLVVNIVKRYGLYRKITHKLALDIIGRAGGGVIMPGVESGFGKHGSLSSTQNSGTDLDAELGLRWITNRHVYLELGYRYDYASLGSIQVNNGTATQNITSQKLTLNLGYTFSCTHHNPLFTRGWPHRKVINKPKPMYKKEEDY